MDSFERARELLAAELKDPHVVHGLMLKGVIAKPSWRSIVDLMGEVPNGEEVQLARIAELQHELAALKARIAEAPIGRVDAPCAGDAVVVDELPADVLPQILKQRVRLLREDDGRGG